MHGPHQDLCGNVHRFIQETAHQQTVIYPPHGLPLRNKKEQNTDTCNNMAEFQKHDAE